MATTTAPPAPVNSGRKRRSRKRKLTRLSRGDRITIFVMAAVPTLLVAFEIKGIAMCIQQGETSVKHLDAAALEVRCVKTRSIRC